MSRLVYKTDRSLGVFSSLDWLTVLLYLVMVTAGVFSIYAASYDFDGASFFDMAEFSGKQIMWIGISLFVALILVVIHPRMYDTYAYPIYLFMVLVLILTIFISPNIKGSHSWISLGGMSIQPAEFAKSATALALGKLFSTYNFRLNDKIDNYYKALAFIFVPVVIILAQNETGSALTFMALFLVLYREGMSGLILFAAFLAVVIFVVSVKWAESVVMGMAAGQFWVLLIIMLVMVVMTAMYNRRRDTSMYLSAVFGLELLAQFVLTRCGVDAPYTAMMVLVVLGGAVYIGLDAMRSRLRRLWVPVMTAVLSVCFLFSVGVAFDQLQPHQQLRIKVVLGIEQDVRKAGYNVNQSKIAIGSGGLAGKGFLNGTQTKLKFVPEQHTDFIFCTIGEEQGFLGATAVMALFVALILRVLALAERQTRVFGRVYGYCVASYLLFHFFVNIGMVIGLCPVIGIPLPFFSYGGSSLLGFTMLLFILLSIDARREA